MNLMPVVVRQSGPFGPALVLLGTVVLFLTARTAWIALGKGAGSRRIVSNHANTVLFWGGASAVLGFLGQCQSTFLAMNAILAAPEIDPHVIADGFVITFFPTLIGFGIFAFSGVSWVCLRTLPQRARSSLPPRS